MSAQEAGMETKFCVGCGKPLHKSAAQCPACGARQAGASAGGKSRVAAALFAIFLGWLGVHKFYLGKPGMGILYLLLFWTVIPGLAGIIEGIIYLTMSDEAFAAKYG